MNVYTVEFFARCPTNDVRIKYVARIEYPSGRLLPVEELLAEVSAISSEFHEKIADVLFGRFGGIKQTIVAEHHGVTIETTRA